MCMHDSTLAFQPLLSASQSAALRLAASQLSGPKRRAFAAELALKHCGGNPWLADTLFWWGRQTVAWGLAERRTGSLCLGAQAAFRGRKRWAERHPQVAAALRQLAGAPAPPHTGAWATSPDVSHELHLHAAHGPGGREGAARAGR